MHEFLNGFIALKMDERGSGVAKVGKLRAMRRCGRLVLRKKVCSVVEDQENLGIVELFGYLTNNYKLGRS